MRKIVFFGNCQAHTLEAVYSASLAPRRGETSVFVSCYDDSTKLESARHVAEADVIVAQVFDAGQVFDLDINATSAEIIPFPTVALGFLWPYGGVARLDNAALPYWNCGPYDYLMGDNYLNRMIKDGVAPESAVERYLALDVAKATHVDRLHELVIGRQRARDERSGMRFADEMEDHFRAEPIFLNHYHPNERIARSLASKVFRRLGVEGSAVDDLISRWIKTPFERTALPIHPRIAAHFGLAYGHVDERYLYHTGERLTFEEFARRYAAGRWNEALLKGVATKHWGGGQVFDEFSRKVPEARLDEAIANLEAGLTESRGSSLGERALATLLDRRGRRGDALAALKRAVEVDATDGEAHTSLGLMHERDGRWGEAEACFRSAIVQDPALFDPYAGLARCLTARGELEEAAANLEIGSRIQPNNGFCFFDLAELNARLDRFPAAETAYRRATDLLPDRSQPPLRLAETLIGQKRFEEAETCLEVARERDTADAGMQPEIDRIGRLLKAKKRGRLGRLFEWAYD